METSSSCTRQHASGFRGRTSDMQKRKSVWSLYLNPTQCHDLRLSNLQQRSGWLFSLSWNQRKLSSTFFPFLLGHSEIDFTCLAEMETWQWLYKTKCMKLFHGFKLTRKTFQSNDLPSWRNGCNLSCLKSLKKLTTSKKTPDQAQCLLAKANWFTTLRVRN